MNLTTWCISYYLNMSTLLQLMDPSETCIEFARLQSKVDLMLTFVASSKNVFDL